MGSLCLVYCQVTCFSMFWFRLYPIVLIVETHIVKKVCSCDKNSHSFFLLSFLLWFLFFLDIKEMIGFLFITLNTAQLFANIAKDRPTVCRHCQIWPNIFAIIAKH